MPVAAELWYDVRMVDDTFLEGLSELKLHADGDGRWASDGNTKEIVDFIEGISITSRILPDRPEFDITSIHMGRERTGLFLHDAIVEHIAVIDRRTKELNEKGLAAAFPKKSQSS